MVVEAGHSAGLELENSDEKHDPCRIDLSLGVSVANAQSFALEMPPAPHQASQQ